MSSEPDLGLTIEQAKDVAVTTSELLETLYDFNDINCALQVLASAVSYILCNDMSSGQQACDTMNKFNEVVQETVNTAQRLGMASWTDGTTH